MSTVKPTHTSRTLREQADELAVRLDRIAAAAVLLRRLTTDIRHDVPPASMVPLLDDLRRDFMLATRELEGVRERSARVLAS